MLILARMISDLGMEKCNKMGATMSFKSDDDAENIAREGKPQRGRHLLYKLERCRGLKWHWRSNTVSSCKVIKNVISDEKSQFPYRKVGDEMFSQEAKGKRYYVYDSTEVPEGTAGGSEGKSESVT